MYIRRIACMVVFMLTSLLGFTASQPITSRGAVAAEQCFPETGKCVSGRFYDYWLANGGLRQQGLPISDEFDEVNPTNGRTYRTQYFERARFEYHPENAPPYDVLLGLLGREQFLAKYPGGKPGGGAPPPSNLIYQADWSNGLNGWSGNKEWKTVSGMLVNDGTTDSLVYAPFNSPTANYAVEAEIQFPDFNSHYGTNWGAGIFVRSDNSGRYRAGVFQDYVNRPEAYIWITSRDSPLARRGFNPGEGYHLYRVEASGNTVKLFIDGALYLETTDNRFLSGVQMGLWSRAAQINVRSFKVFKL